VIAAAVFATLLQATSPAATGTPVERVACPSDPTQTYTLYLPTKYNTDRKWPLLFVFDPRGRGTQAAEVFKNAAERFGWIIASSDNTMSDGEWEPNRRALAAMWPDVRRAYAVDERRIYTTGFSGGATVAWILAVSSGSVSGIIGVGAPYLADAKLPSQRVAWFGTAGRADFNFIHIQAMHDRVARAGMPHRVAFFEGGHQWLPPALASRALGWLEIRAMRDGLRPPDRELAQAVMKDELAYARELDSKGKVTDEYRTYESIAMDFEGVVDTTEAITARAALEKDARLRSAQTLEDRADARERSTVNALTKTLGVLYESELPLPAQLLASLGVKNLRKAAEGQGYEAESATRILEVLAVRTSFYIPREFEARKQYDRAALALEIATALYPDRPRPWLELAANRTLLDQKGRAIAALEHAIDAGLRDARAVTEDARFAGILQSADVQKLLQRTR
jgi:predicted esterase